MSSLVSSWIAAGDNGYEATINLSMRHSTDLLNQAHLFEKEHWAFITRHGYRIIQPSRYQNDECNQAHLFEQNRRSHLSPLHRTRAGVDHTSRFVINSPLRSGKAINPCSPGACTPGACSHGACSPGACSPGACSPGACSHGACDCDVHWGCFMIDVCGNDLNSFALT